MGDVDKMGEAMNVWGQGVYGKFLLWIWLLT